MATVPQLIAVLAVFVLLGSTLWWLRKRASGEGGAAMPFRLPSRNRNQPKVLQRIDTLRLSPTHVLNLIKMADRAILIGTSPSGFYLVESSAWKTLQLPDEIPS